MKRFLIIFVPLALFAGFLTIKPPALGANATTPAVTTADPVVSPASPQDPLSTPPIGKPTIGKPGISGGDDEDDDDYEDDEENEEDEEEDEEKPTYGGHDDDDYDD